MYPDAFERIRTHRRTLAARWSRYVISTPDASLVWQDVQRIDRNTLAGMEAVAEAGATGKVDLFGDFAGRFSQEAFALGVPLDELIRALLQVKPVVQEFLAEGSPAAAPDADIVQFLNRLISVGLLEAIRRHERQRDRRALALQEQIDDLRERLRRQVLVDPVTGLFNANYFAIAVRREMLRSRRFDRTFTVGLVALDQDNEIKESLGEEGLQAVTIELADVLTHATRQVDFRASLGGGRFGIILPETSLDGGFILAERLRQAVESRAFAMPDHPFPLTQTVSIGLASFPRDGKEDQVLLARSEEALARARAGKNTTVVAATVDDF